MEPSASPRCSPSRRLACVLGLVAVPLLSHAVRAQEEGAAGADEIWILELKPVRFGIVTPERGPGKGVPYWYLVYTLRNKTGADRDFRLSISASSDRKKTYSDLFLPTVERAVEEREGRRLWGKSDHFAAIKDRDPEDPRSAYTTIEDGETRYCVAVFNRLDTADNKFTVRVSGLSNDLEPHVKPDGTETVRERVYLIHAERPGDEYEVTNDSFHRVRTEWVKEDIEAGVKTDP